MLNVESFIPLSHTFAALPNFLIVSFGFPRKTSSTQLKKPMEVRAAPLEHAALLERIRSCSARMAVVGLGFVGNPMHDSFYLKPNIEAYKTNISQPMGASPESPTKPDPIIDGQALNVRPQEVVKNSRSIKITKTPFVTNRPVSGKFVRFEGPKLGLDKGFKYGIRDYPDPFWIGRGTGAGDYNQDGWTDIMFGSDQG